MTEQAQQIAIETEAAEVDRVAKLRSWLDSADSLVNEFIDAPMEMKVATQTDLNLLFCEVRELIASYEMLEGLMEGKPEIIRMVYEQGSGIDLTFKHWAVRVLAESFIETLGDAPNYLELGLNNGKKFVVVTIRHQNGKTPSQMHAEELIARQLAERRAGDLQERVDQLTKELAEARQPQNQDAG